MATESLQRPPHTELFESLTTPEAVQVFLENNFDKDLGSSYARLVMAYLARQPHRLENPQYMMFFSSIIFEAAEFGYASPFGHIDTLKYMRDGYDVMDPRALLAMGARLAQLNIQSAAIKTVIIDDLKRMGKLDDKMEKKVWASWCNPGVGGLMYLPEAEDFAFDYIPSWISTSRLECGLTIFVSDTNFHEKIVSINFNRSHIDTMSREVFVEEKLPLVEKAFDFIPDIAAIFLNPNENWSVHSR